MLTFVGGKEQILQYLLLYKKLIQIVVNVPRYYPYTGNYTILFNSYCISNIDLVYDLIVNKVITKFYCLLYIKKYSKNPTYFQYYITSLKSI